ncbi:MAG TPA: hypothetical protein VKB75_16700 [Jatrophihabitans sp.]|nr:hypothetical protein [Jatrophihabitans sp.]
MSGLKTSYEFTLPRGYVDEDGRVHRVGRMRLATARDELDPLRDPLVTGPDDPRLTLLVLSRVIEELGDIAPVGTPVIEGLFAVDLAFLQDFYGVINFGTQEEFDALMEAQRQQTLVGAAPATATVESAAEVPARGDVQESSTEPTSVPADAPVRSSLRSAVEELPRMAL